MNGSRPAFLITGVAKGLGRYLFERYGGLGLTRQNASPILARAGEGVETIIHCAFNSAKSVGVDDVVDYMADNVTLTERLLEVPHRRFVFLSSVDVYGKAGALKTEGTPIVVEAGLDPYSFTKLVGEALVRQRGRQHLIIRPTQLLGPYRRRNALMRILDEPQRPLYLSDDSVLNFILYDDVRGLIDAAVRGDLSGIVNVASSTNVTLREIATAYGKTVAWGTYRYDIGNISNERARLIVPALGRTSLEAVQAFVGPPAG